MTIEQSRHPRRPNDHGQYLKIFAAIDEYPPGSASHAMAVTIPRVQNAIVRAFGIVPHEDESKRGRNVHKRLQLENGMTALYWNGSEVVYAPFSDAVWTADHLAIIDRIAVIADKLGKPPAILDIGAGLSVLGIACRYRGYDWPVISIEVDEAALRSGRRMCESAGIHNRMHFVQSHLSEAVCDVNERARLSAIIRQCAEGLPIVVVSRIAIRPFYERHEAENLKDFIVNDLACVAGLHLEWGGEETPTFKGLARHLPALDAWCSKSSGENAIDLFSQPPLVVTERVELWPHFLGWTSLTFLSWMMSSRG